MSVNVKHKYPWKAQQIITLSILFLIPIVLTALMILTNTVHISVVIIVGGVSLVLGLSLLRLNIKRLKKSTLHATVDNDGILTIWGAGLDEKTNKGNPEELQTITFDEKSYHPTLVFVYEDGHMLKVPRRIALVPELNEYLRHHMPKTLQVTNNARETFEAIFVPAESRAYKAPLTQELEAEENIDTTVTATGEKENQQLGKIDAKKRKLALKEEKRQKDERLADIIAAAEAEEKKLSNTSSVSNRMNYNDLNAPDYDEPKVVVEPADEAKDGDFPVNNKVERNTYT